LVSLDASATAATISLGLLEVLGHVEAPHQTKKLCFCGSAPARNFRSFEENKKEGPVTRLNVDLMALRPWAMSYTP
jgi:hypothetical protein